MPLECTLYLCCSRWSLLLFWTSTLSWTLCVPLNECFTRVQTPHLVNLFCWRQTINLYKRSFQKLTSFGQKPTLGIITFENFCLHIDLNEARQTYSISLEIHSSLYISYTSFLDWHDGRHILSSCGILSPVLSTWSRNQVILSPYVLSLWIKRKLTF